MRLPLLSIDGNSPREWVSTTIRKLGKDEAFLEAQIGAAPALLGLEDFRTNVRGPYAAFHQLGVETPMEQIVAPDIVFLTGSGHVVVVEVKLADNGELRGRKVIAQIVEYAASLAGYSEEELVELFDKDLPEGSRFSDVVRKHLSSSADPVRLGAEIVRKIRAAELHLVVACDQAPEGLHEFVSSVTAQQALGNYEIRVCELVPFVPRDGGVGAILVPSGILHTEVVARTVVEVRAGGVAGGRPLVTAHVTPQDEVQANLAAAVGKEPIPTHPAIAAAAAAYAAIAEPGTMEAGVQPNYRFVKVDGWPGALHYEFIRRKLDKTIGVELHFEAETDKVKLAAAAVRDAHFKPSPELPGLAWDPNWSTGKGRLRVVFPDDTDPNVLARTMVALIRKTRATVDGAMAE